MTRRRFQNSISWLAALAVVSAPLASEAANTSEFWSQYQFSKKLTKQLDLRWQPQFRIRDDWGELQYYQFNTGLGFQWVRWLELATYHAFIRQENSKHEWENEHRWIGDAILKTTLGPFKISDRHRVLSKWLPNSEQRWSYRNLLKLGYPITVMAHKATPYVADEGFWEDGEFGRNRAYLGFELPLRKELTLDFYYLLETNKRTSDNKWSHRHVIGTVAKVSF